MTKEKVCGCVCVCVMEGGGVRTGQPSFCDSLVINICCPAVKHDSWCLQNLFPVCPVLPAIMVMVKVSTPTEGRLNNA